MSPDVPIRIALVVLTLSTGGFMLVDGIRYLDTGTYFVPSLGPWSVFVSSTGLDPRHFLRTAHVGLVVWQRDSLRPDHKA